MERKIQQQSTLHNTTQLTAQHNTTNQAEQTPTIGTQEKKMRCMVQIQEKLNGKTSGTFQGSAKASKGQKEEKDLARAPGPPNFLGSHRRESAMRSVRS